MDGMASASRAILRSSAFGAAGDHDLGSGRAAKYSAVWRDDDTLVREGSVSGIVAERGEGRLLMVPQHAEEWEAEV